MDMNERDQATAPSPAPTAGDTTDLGGTLTEFEKFLREHGDDHNDPDFDPIATAFSRYAGPLKPNRSDNQSGDRNTPAELLRIPRGQLWPEKNADFCNVDPWAQTVHDMLRTHILGPHYPCLGARAAMKHGTYRVGYYKCLGHENSVAANARDLKRFVSEYTQIAEPARGFTAFIALFKYPQSTSEVDFEQLLWRHLQMMNDVDTAPWDPHYSPDPNDPMFGFSFAGSAFQVIGMHPGASRLSRLLPRPALVFNPESQILRLQEQGMLAHFTDEVRARDTRYQGSTNPEIRPANASTGGEGNVYSGMHHKTPFVCPFHAKQAASKDGK
jgi:FPC/CPF motif-containing protein YcgG